MTLTTYEIMELSASIIDVMGIVEPGKGYLGGELFKIDSEYDVKYGIKLNEAFNILRADMLKNMDKASRKDYNNQAVNIPIVDIYAYCTWKMQNHKPKPINPASLAVMRVMLL